MARWIRRSMWLVGAVTVLICSVLAASALTHVIAGLYLASAPVPRMAPAPAPAPAEPERSKDGAILTERNMFCSDCDPAPEATLAEAAQPQEIPLTSLPLELVATHVAADARRSSATLRNTRSSHQGAFFIGDTIPGAGPIERVTGRTVTFRNSAANRLERLSLLEDAPAPSPPPLAAPGMAPGATGFDDQRIAKVDDTTYRVERSLVTQLMTNPMQLGARVVPALQGGELHGFRLIGVRGASPLAAIGLRSGDIIRSINGQAMTADTDALLALYARLKDAPELTVVVERQGRDVAFRYRVE